MSFDCTKPGREPVPTQCQYPSFPASCQSLPLSSLWHLVLIYLVFRLSIISIGMHLVSGGVLFIQARSGKKRIGFVRINLSPQLALNYVEPERLTYHQLKRFTLNKTVPSRAKSFRGINMLVMAISLAVFMHLSLAWPNRQIGPYFTNHEKWVLRQCCSYIRNYANQPLLLIWKGANQKIFLSGQARIVLTSAKVSTEPGKQGHSLSHSPGKLRGKQSIFQRDI